MKKKTSPSDSRPVGKLVRVTDFLLPPGELIPEEDTVKITLALDKDTLRFFKGAADKAGTKYQRMIREVLKGYAKKYG